jgi:hypothetical protein
MMSKKEMMILLLLSAINFTHILDFMIMMPLGNYLMPFFHITPMQFSFLAGAYTLMGALPMTGVMASCASLGLIILNMGRKRIAYKAGWKM